LSVLDIVNTNESLHSFWRTCRVEVVNSLRRKFDWFIIYFCGTFGKSEIEELFKTKVCSRGRWPSSARSSISIFRPQMQSLVLFH
jgi:hypothetical protein